MGFGAIQKGSTRKKIVEVFSQKKKRTHVPWSTGWRARYKNPLSKFVLEDVPKHIATRVIKEKNRIRFGLHKSRYVPQYGGGRTARHVAPDLSDYWKGTLKFCDDDKWDYMDYSPSLYIQKVIF